MTVRRPALHLGALTALLGLTLALALGVGAVPLGLPVLARALGGAGDANAVAIVQRLRLPRAAQSALVGAALSLSGAAFQALLRNPLADPYVLGVSGGAAVGAVLVVVLGLDRLGIWSIPAAAFLGSLAAIGVVLRIATAAGGALGARVLVLAGVMVSALCNAVILIILTFADAESFRSALFWLMGSNAGATAGGVAFLGAVVAVGALAFGTLARPLNLFGIGDQTAAVLGVQVRATKLAAFLIASLLAAAAVSVSGAIGFVGLVVPHIVRLVWGADHRLLLPASALLGAAFMVGADALARTAAAPMELPIGAITAFTGVPFFLWLLTRRAA